MLKEVVDVTERTFELCLAKGGKETAIVFKPESSGDGKTIGIFAVEQNYRARFLLDALTGNRELRGVVTHPRLVVVYFVDEALRIVGPASHYYTETDTRNAAGTTETRCPKGIWKPSKRLAEIATRNHREVQQRIEQC